MQVKKKTNIQAPRKNTPLKKLESNELFKNVEDTTNYL